MKEKEIRIKISRDKHEKVKHHAERMDMTPAMFSLWCIMEKVCLMDAQEAQGAGPVMANLLLEQIRKEKEIEG